MKTIKIKDLFNKIANGEEVPYKIKYDNKDYTYDSEVQDYWDDNYDYLFEKFFKEKDTSMILEIEVEILDEEKEDSFTGIRFFQDGVCVMSVNNETPTLEEDEFEDIKPLVLKTFERTGQAVTIDRLADYYFDNFKLIEDALAKVILNQKKIIGRIKNEK